MIKWSLPFQNHKGSPDFPKSGTSVLQGPEQKFTWGLGVQRPCTQSAQVFSPTNTAHTGSITPPIRSYAKGVISLMNMNSSHQNSWPGCSDAQFNKAPVALRCIALHCRNLARKARKRLLCPPRPAGHRGRTRGAQPVPHPCQTYPFASR